MEPWSYQEWALDPLNQRISVWLLLSEQESYLYKPQVISHVRGVIIICHCLAGTDTCWWR